jgi:O-antigen/teichoic acid export membrane protein
MIRSLLKDSAVYMVPTILSRGAGIFLLPLYTRYLTPADYGVVDMVNIFGGIAWVIVTLEVNQGFARFYTDSKSVEEKNIMATTVLVYTILSYFAFYLIMEISLSSMTSLLFGEDNYSGVFRLGIVYVTIYGINVYLNVKLRYDLKSMLFAINNTINFVVSALTSIYFIAYLEYGVDGVLFGLISGNIISLMLHFYFVKTSITRTIDLGKLKNMLVFSAPLIVSSLTVILAGYVDRMMVNHYLSLSSVGLYGMAFRLSSIVLIILHGINGALMPLVYTHYKSESTPKNLAQIFKYFLVSAMFVYLIVAIFSKEIFQILTTPAFYPSSEIVIFLFPAILMSKMHMFFPGVAIAKRTKITMGISILKLSIGVIMNTLLIPVIGVVGAAIATLITFTIGFVVNYYFSEKYYSIPVEWLSVGKLLLILFILMLISLNLNEEWKGTIIAKILLIGVYPIAILRFRIIEKKYLDYVYWKSFLEKSIES